MPEGYPGEQHHHSAASCLGEVKPALVLKLDAAFATNQYSDGPKEQTVRSHLPVEVVGWLIQPPTPKDL